MKILKHVFSEKGIQIDRNKIKVIEIWWNSKCKKDLERFLGCLIYKYFFYISQLAVSLRKLLKKDRIDIDMKYKKKHLMS